MSDILILGSAGFVGSNIANYLIQNTKYTIASVDNLTHDEKQLRNLAPAMGAKNRHTFYLADVSDVEIMTRVLEIEKPRVIIYNCIQCKGGKYKWWDEVRKFEEFASVAQNFLRGTPEKFIVLYESLYRRDWWWDNLDAAIGRTLPNLVKDEDKWYSLASCELFGPRQSDPWLGVSGAAGSYLHAEDFKPDESDDPKQWMYIKDYFSTLLQLIEKNDVESGKYQVMSGQWATDNQVWSFVRHLIKGAEYEEWDPHEPLALHEAYEGYKHLPVVVNTELISALEHTTAWYKANEWVWGV